MKLVIGLLVVAGVVAMACGGSGGENARLPGGLTEDEARIIADNEPNILMLPEGDFTEGTMRVLMRGLIDTFGVELWCADYLGRSDEEVLQATIEDYQLENPDVHVRPLADVSEDDLLRAAIIQREECERAAG